MRSRIFMFNLKLERLNPMKQLKNILQFFLIIFFGTPIFADFLWAMEDDEKTFSHTQRPSEKPSDGQTHKSASSPKSSDKEIDKLTKEHCQQLKGICSQFVTEQMGPIPLDPRAGWIKPGDLDDLNILCYLEQKKWKNDNSLATQIQKALERFYQLTENLFFMSGTKLVKSMRDRLSKDLWKIDDPLKAISLISGFHETKHPTTEEISPYEPIMQRMMHNFVSYYSETKNLNLGHLYGTIPVGDNKILAYVRGYFPIPIFCERTREDYEIYRLPYPSFCKGKQGVCLADGKGKIITDTGLVLKHEDIYGSSLMKNAFIYCGSENETPFTMSPFELMSVNNFTKEDSSEALLKTLLGKDFPLPGTTAFIPLPEKEQDKNIVELIFLEELQEEGNKGSHDALRMITYIEKETDQKLDELIKTLTHEQLRIIEEQGNISKAVSEDHIVGRTKQKNKPTNKDKSTKKFLSSDKKDKSSNQQIPTKSLDKGKLSHEKLQDIKSKGRVKYRKVVGIINRIMKHPVSHALTEESNRGSHKTIHSDKGVVTSVRPHGKKDLTIPSGGVKRFTERLLKILDLK